MIVAHLPTTDIVVLLVYLAAVVGFGCWFVRKSGTTAEFMAAGRSLPGWAVGLSLFGTYLSSNTFIGVPGKAYGGDWNFFVFSLSLPIAAWLAVRYFVPFYRQSGEISAYHHLEKRFGVWARTYAVVCYLLMQFARIGSVMFGVAIAMSALTGWSMPTIIVLAGASITVYTMLGGIEAVIWTDVVQSIVLMVGAILVLLLLTLNMPEGPWQIVRIGMAEGKFSLGSFRPNFTISSFWVVLIYGLLINLTNFGIDQSFVQRYHTARSDAEACRSVWLAALLYVPISLLFFVIGTSLFAYYRTHPESRARLEERVAVESLKIEEEPNDSIVVQKQIESQADKDVGDKGVGDEDIGDKVLPDFIVHNLPTGAAGLLVAAIFAAAMSSIDTSLNSSATIILTDIYKRYFRPHAGERESMRVLRLATIGMGGCGTGIALAMIGIQSVLEAWWTLSGVFAGGMLGLFLLGMIATRADKHAAVTGVVIGILVILWATFSSADGLGDVVPEILRSPLHKHMAVVVGTLTIFLVGVLVSRLRRHDL